MCQGKLRMLWVAQVHVPAANKPPEHLLEGLALLHKHQQVLNAYAPVCQPRHKCSNQLHRSLDLPYLLWQLIAMQCCAVLSRAKGLPQHYFPYLDSHVTELVLDQRRTRCSQAATNCMMLRPAGTESSMPSPSVSKGELCSCMDPGHFVAC